MAGPVLAVALWFGYMWFVSRVLAIEEKYPGGTIKAQGYVRRQGLFGEYKRQGKWVEFHADGSKAAEGIYKAGEKIGNWQYWNAENTSATTKTTQ